MSWWRVECRPTLCIDRLLIECQSSVDQVLIRKLIECLIKMPIEGIDQHLTADAFTSHDPIIVYLCIEVQKSMESQVKTQKGQLQFDLTNYSQTK